MKKIEDKTLYSGFWLNFKEGRFVNNQNQVFSWEYIERKNNASIIIVIPYLIPSNRMILIRQFRCPINNYILGFPAGVAHNDESEKDIAEEALRELREETGYTGKVMEISPVLKASSGIMDDRVRIVHIAVDETLPENQNPAQDLEPEEEIEVIIKERSHIKRFLQEEIEKGTAVGAGLWYLFGMMP